jgi:RNA recognition motif-containing protein
LVSGHSAAPVLAFTAKVRYCGPFRRDPENMLGSPTGDDSVGKRLYVGNLAYSVTNDSLEQLFAEFGTVVSAQVIQDRDTGRSKGFGFVEMQDEDAGQKAISALNEKEHDGRALTVNEAKPRESSGSGGGRGYGGGGGGGGRRY